MVHKQRDASTTAADCVESLDLIAKARQDLTAPLPCQFDPHLQQEHQRQQPNQLHSAPGSLRCVPAASSLSLLPGSSHGPAYPSQHSFSFTANCPPPGGELEAEVEQLKSERRQLVEWADDLSQQVKRLEYDKAGLEKNMEAAAVAASTTQKQLEGDLAHVKRWAADCERQANVKGAAATENEALRKQLAAYSVEVDTLREEKDCLQKSHSEAQEAVRQLTDETQDLGQRNENLLQQNEDLQQRNEELLKKLEKSSEPSVDHKHDAQVLREREHSKALANALKSVREFYSELQEGFVAQTREFDIFSQQTKEKQRDAEQQLSAAKGKAKHQQEVTMQLLGELAKLRGECESRRELQEQLEQQARKAESCAAELANKQRDWHRERQGLQDHLVKETRQRLEVEEEISRREQVQRERNVTRQRRLDRDPALLRLERALERNIARDMYELHMGAVLEKVHERNCRREPRLVQVSADQMVLRWSKDLQSMNRSCSSLDLYEVIRIHYGGMARACVLHTEVPPWLCFSLYTPRRSYDFCCPDEETVQRFVLGLSRLCDWASGTVATRRRFIALRGWCKLEDACFRQQMSLGQLFFRALTRIVEAPSQLGQLQSPAPPTPPVVLLPSQ